MICLFWGFREPRDSSSTRRGIGIAGGMAWWGVAGAGRSSIHGTLVKREGLAWGEAGVRTTPNDLVYDEGSFNPSRGLQAKTDAVSLLHSTKTPPGRVRRGLRWRKPLLSCLGEMIARLIQITHSASPKSGFGGGMVVCCCLSTPPRSLNPASSLKSSGGASREGGKGRCVARDLHSRSPFPCFSSMKGGGVLTLSWTNPISDRPHRRVWTVSQFRVTKNRWTEGGVESLAWDGRGRDAHLSCLCIARNTRSRSFVCFGAWAGRR